MSRIGRLSQVLALMASVLSLPAVARAAPEGARWSEAYVRSADGTMLHADVLLPASLRRGRRVPVILVVGPYHALGNYRSVPGPQDEGHDMHVLYTHLANAGRIFERGYAFVQVDLRGTGSSDGCYDIGGPGEQADVHAAVEWAASQPWSTGRVGMFGSSYDAWTQVMALASRPRGLAAAVIQNPLIDPYAGVYDNGIPAGFAAAAMPLVFPGAYAVTDVLPPTPFSSPDEIVADVHGRAWDPPCPLDHVSGASSNDRRSSFWRARDLVDRAASSRVPTFWTKGLNDHNTPPDQFLQLYPRLRGAKRAWVGQWEHRIVSNPANAAAVGRQGGLGEVLAWYDRYLKGIGPDPSATPTYVQQYDGRWRAESVWPPSDAKPFPLPLRAGSFQDTPGNSAEKYNPHTNDVPNGAGAFWQLPTGVGNWTFTLPLPYDLHFAGEPKLSATVQGTAGSHLVALLYDVDGQGTARFVSRGAALLKGTGGVSFRMWPQDWRFVKGHRIGVLLTSADDSWYGSPTTLGTVHVSKATLALPFLRLGRNRFIDGGPAEAMRNHGPFPVSAETIRRSTVSAPLPPPMED